MKNVISQAGDSKRLALTLVQIVILISGIRGDSSNETEQYVSGLIADLWLEGADVVRIIWRDCSKKLVDVKDVIDHKEYFPKFVRCMKRKTLRALDRSLSPDVVPISDGVSFVRYELVDNTGNIMSDNETSAWSEKELEESEWRTLAIQRMAKVLRTHVIKFDFDKERIIEKAEYRGRRRHQMLTMMMFGVVSIGMVLIPMGFQFLAVLGGKALLLAKMALILASIQGLKKIASSPVNYGFYHSFPPYDHFERRSRDDWPRPGVNPSTTSPPTSFYSPWSNIETGGIKVDRIHIAETNDIKIVKRGTEEKTTDTPRLYPIYTGPSQGPLPAFSGVDAPTPLVDLTTRPGEVQADYSLELPYNGFRFQSPTTLVPA